MIGCTLSGTIGCVECKPPKGLVTKRSERFAADADAKIVLGDGLT